MRVELQREPARVSLARLLLFALAIYLLFSNPAPPSSATSSARDGERDGDGDGDEIAPEAAARRVATQTADDVDRRPLRAARVRALGAELLVELFAAPRVKQRMRRALAIGAHNATSPSDALDAAGLQRLLAADALAATSYYAGRDGDAPHERAAGANESLHDWWTRMQTLARRRFRALSATNRVAAFVVAHRRSAPAVAALSAAAAAPAALCDGVEDLFARGAADACAPFAKLCDGGDSGDSGDGGDSGDSGDGGDGGDSGDGGNDENGDDDDACVALRSFWRFAFASDDDAATLYASATRCEVRGDEPSDGGHQRRLLLPTCGEPRRARRGDLARTFLFLRLRHAHDAWRGVPSGVRRDVARWLTEDPLVDDVERARHAVLAAAQLARNPFVDFPSLAGEVLSAAAAAATLDDA